MTPLRDPQAPPPYKIITFDCYGTLVQWHEVFEAEIGGVLAARGADPANATAILASFSDHSRRLTAEPYRPYRTVLREGLSAAFSDHGVTCTHSELERLTLAPTRMRPHPDVPNALRRLRERFQLAIFTNSDDDLIAPTVASLGVPVDYVITAQQAQAYKPARQLFEHAYRQMGVTPSQTVHVAMGMYTDMKACHELGLRGIWVNRRAEEGNAAWLPYEEVRNLTEASALLL